MPSVLYRDEVHVRQVINNFLSNAVKYTKEGKVILRMGFERKAGEQILLKVEVEDTGIGIKESDMDKLFLNFTRVDEQKNRNIQGTGLGLSLTKNLVELMGGKIHVTSEYGKGSVFTATIPQHIANPEPLGDFAQKYQQYIHSAELDNHVLQVPKAKILVVDDVEMNLKVAQSYLKQTDAKVDIAYSGEECLRMICQKKYDIIFLDHMMPEMDGIETLKVMKQSKDHPNGKTPVIALTANAVVGAKEKYLEERFPTLNTQLGMGYCMNDESFFLEMIDTYIRGDKRDVLAKEYAEGSWENYHVHVHALKSTSLNIGAERLSEHAKALELAAKDADYPYIQEHHEEVMTEYGKLLVELQNGRGGKTNE